MQKIYAKPLYADIIDLARAAGLWGATANGMHAGFTYEGKKSAEFAGDAGNVNVHIYLELIGPRAQLEAFFQQIQPLLGANRVTTYTELEHWGEA